MKLKRIYSINSIIVFHKKCYRFFNGLHSIWDTLRRGWRRGYHSPHRGWWERGRWGSCWKIWRIRKRETGSVESLDLLGRCWRWNSRNWKEFWDVFDANARGCRGPVSDARGCRSPGCLGVTVWSWRWEASLVDVGHIVWRRRKVQVVIVVVIFWKIFKKNILIV